MMSPISTCAITTTASLPIVCTWPACSRSHWTPAVLVPSMLSGRTSSSQAGSEWREFSRISAIFCASAARLPESLLK